MRLRHIEVFYAVYNTGSISDAARFLHVSQPSVSKVLSHAEMQLGFQLFVRVKGKLVPTSEAHSLIEEVRKIYQQLGAIKKTAHNLKEHTHGHIRVVCMPALGLNLLPDAIKSFNAKYPNITFDVQTKHYDQIIESIYEHENDLAIVFTDRDHPGIETELIGTGELVYIAPAGALEDSDDKRMALTDIDTENFISISNTGPLGDLLSQRFATEQIQPSTLIKAQTYYLARNLVARGLGYSILDEFTASADRNDEVETRGFEPPIQFQLKCFHHASQPLSKTSSDFVDFIRKAYTQLQRH